MSPTIAFQIGGSYGLVGTALVVPRFGEDRYRIDLRECQGTTMRLGDPCIRFRGRAVWLSWLVLLPP